MEAAAMSKYDRDRYDRGNRREPIIPNLITSALIIATVAIIVAILSAFGR
jgi:hypothetical protein